MTLSRTIRYVCFTLALAGLYACNDATATPKPQNAPEPKHLTRAECLAMDVKEDKIKCFGKLAEQRKAEIAKKETRLKATQANIEKIENENEALLKEFEKDVLDEE